MTKQTEQLKFDLTPTELSRFRAIAKRIGNGKHGQYVKALRVMMADAEARIVRTRKRK